MTIENSGTIRCPHCAREIKALARVCRHCKVAVADATSAVSNAASQNSTPPVMLDLRGFTVGRGVIRSEQFDALVAQHRGADAAVMLGQLAAAGYITAVQVESLREGFRQQQESRAAGLLRVATERGLLTPVHVEQALAGFRGALFQQTIGEYVTSAGLLTATQATELQRSTTVAGSVLVGVTGRWGRLSKTARGVVYTLVGLQVAWMVIYGAVLVVDAVRGHADIDQNATMNGWGRGTSTFTNRGSRAGSVCGHVFVTCGRGSRSSASFCSGSVAPNETKRVEFSVPGMDRIGTYGRDWRDDCGFEFIRETTGD